MAPDVLRELAREVAERLASPEARERLAVLAASSRERARAIVESARPDQALMSRRVTV